MSTDFDFPGFADDFEPPPEGAYDEVPIDDPGDPAAAVVPDTAAPAEPAAALSAQMEAFVARAMDKRISQEADAIAAAKFEEMLTPELHAQLQEAAQARLAAQLAAALEIPDDPEPEPEPQMVFGSAEEFLRDWLAPTYRRQVTDTPSRVWCPQWWKHEEAVNRIEALWRAWEYLRLDAKTGMSVWWRDHADHHMEKLFAGDGPFKACSAERGHKGSVKPLPTDKAPDALFPDQRET
ncbi:MULTISPECIES: DUF4913 domain-containing protein [Rhodococcus]|uniref:DUF4913 domain-containing protein n=1 Tax=Rhodococcus TaxID=1827 RepID=UPI0004C345D2|nr:MULTISPECIES: DUF4913 domain-containing protein [Rhodococcus]MCC4306822.1 DUF4913 domain-containing protein [Rhodococcus sp. 3-2]BBE49106.1 hypothetical protein RE2895_60370 [Rhodococcus erythropolis]